MTGSDLVTHKHVDTYAHTRTHTHTHAHTHSRIGRVHTNTKDIMVILALRLELVIAYQVSDD